MSTKKEFISFEIHRTNEGLMLKNIKSEQLARFFEETSGGQTKDEQIFNSQLKVNGEAVKRLPLYKVRVGNDRNLHLNRGTAPFIDHEENVNLSFLRHPLLSEGFDLSFQELHSQEALENAMKRMRDACERIYTEFMKPMKLEVTVNMEEE